MSRKTSEVRLGQLLIQKQWCSLSRVTAGLREQEELRSQGKPLPLGRILISHGWLDEDTLKEALCELGALVLSCRECDYSAQIFSYQRNRPYSCPRCKSPIDLIDPEERKERSRRRSSSLPRVTAVLEGPPSGSRSASGASATPPAGRARKQRRTPTERAPVETAATDSSSQSRESASGSGPAAQADRDPYVGRVLGGCRLLEKIAQGGMGVIYKATQLNLNRVVAVKVLAEDLAEDDSFVRRFIEEARAAGQLSHHNIVHINDVGESQGLFYFTMEFIDGEDLKTISDREGPLPVDRSLSITLQVCEALRHAHKRGIIHRDIKPENVLITREGVVKLADLGLAKRIEAGQADGLTKAGSIFGTPFYMAPEQAKNFSNVDQRSDIYSLGVALYKTLSGKVPFDGRSPIEIMVKALDGKRPSLRSLRPNLPERVEQLVDKMMARQPEDRFQSVAPIVDELRILLNGLSVSGAGEKLLAFH